MHVAAIIAAGGRGLRFGDARPKQLVDLNGRTILERSVDAFLAHPAVDELVVALPAELVQNPPSCLAAARKPLRVVAGGPRRQDSVLNAFQAIAAATDVILVHDAARPFVSADLIQRTIDAAALHGAVLAAVQARDTVKRAEEGRVCETLDRRSLFLAQTPQGFRRDVLRDALRSDADATDEAELAERAGYPVRIVEGEAMNIKITTPADLEIAEAIVRSGRPARTGRAGLGYDLHRLVPDRPLILGGVTIASDRGALGHSDADVVAHAVTDAILGALSLGDIGGHFPDSDPRWKGAHSLDLLQQVVAMAEARGFELGNVDVTVMLEQPKLRGHIDAIRASLANTLRVDVDRVSVKAKTNEGVDAVGRGEAIAAQAIALVRSR
jgi:2-C-methyl-D-erythritol 4-phosphate cytidylyltransferase / 2-C-methyl-D-erythritol 2,4-cyclodiphosphate synthase